MDRKQNYIARVKSSVLGFAVADALGVPVEFRSRSQLLADPVTGMRSGGTHGQPIGAWSDDTSMTLCVLQSLTEKQLDYTDQMQRFADWLWNASNTAHDVVFDVGGSTRSAIFRFGKGTPALECGDDGEYSCGNGSLMRMLPTALWLAAALGKDRLDDEAAEILHNASACTHAHRRCLASCGIYASVVFRLLAGKQPQDAVAEGVHDALAYYETREDFADVFGDFAGLEEIGSWSDAQIRGSGYVLHTLQASMWCLLTTETYADCVLKAVNLGEDTDTTAAVAGSLAGLRYGLDAIPADWLAVLAKRDRIESTCEAFGYAALRGKDGNVLF